MARWSSGLRLRPLTPTTGVRIPLGSPLCGADYDEDPPVPIPNTVVKLVRAENTWRAASRENRSVPQQKRTVFIVLFLRKSIDKSCKMGHNNVQNKNIAYGTRSAHLRRYRETG